MVSDLHRTLLDIRMSVTSSITGNNLGGLLYYTRRLIAMPFMAFSFCAFSRSHGVSASTYIDGHAVWESLTGLLFPCVQSANLYGVAHPLGGGVGFITNNLTQGV